MNARLLFAGILLFCRVFSADGRNAGEWLREDLPRRTVFSVPRDAGLAVSVVAPLDESHWTDILSAAYGPDGTQVPHCRIYADATQMVSIVQVAGSGAKDRYCLYYGSTPGGHSSDGEAATNSIRPAFVPVILRVHEHGGQSPPNTWDQMRYLYAHSGDPVCVSRCGHLGNLGSQGSGLMDLIVEKRIGDGAGRRRDREKELRNSRWIVHASFAIICPVAGEYRFGVDSRDAAFLLVDGECAAGRPGHHDPGEWRSDRSLYLAAGLHSIDIFNSWQGSLFLDAGWMPPDSDTIEKIPARILAPVAPASVRFDRADSAVYPDFRWKAGRVYYLYGCESVFARVKFDNRTERNGKFKPVFRWDVGGAANARAAGAADGENDAPSVLIGLGPHRVALSAGDGSGRRTTCAKMVDLRLCPEDHYDFSADMESVRPVCYPDDVVRPVLRIDCGAERKMAFDVLWDVKDIRGDRAENAGTVTCAGNGPVELPIGTWQAGDIDSLEWRVVHHGVIVHSEEIRFVRPPFALFPERVEGDRLYAGEGVRAVLVPDRTGGLAARRPMDRNIRCREILCVDDFSAGQAVSYVDILSQEAARENVAVAHLDAGAEDGENLSYRPLLKLVEIPRAVEREGTAVVLSIGSRDMESLVPSETFERHAAALSDLLTRSKGCRVVWVTPFPAPGRRDMARSYAAGMMRVADARNLPVADLFTGFLGAESVRSLVDPESGTMTDTGHKLAANIIAGALSLE